MQIDPKATFIINTLQEAGYKKSVVAGGACRDFAMNNTPKDWDIATSALPQAVIELFPHCVRDGEDQGVIKVIIDKEVIDVATLRKDGSYSDGRRPDSVEFTDSLEEDSRRRDFCMNAIFYDPINDNFIDYHGGISDINNKYIRSVGRATDRFMEDKLRMMRAIRFSTQLNFEIVEPTRWAIKEFAPYINQISAERIRDEFYKILATDKPSGGIWLLYHTKLLQYILREVEQLYGCEQDPIHHPEGDVFLHSLIVMNGLPKEDPDLRFAGLLHDIGKYYCREARIEAGCLRISNIGHAEQGALMIESIADRFALSNAQKNKIYELVLNHMRMHFGKDMKKSKLVSLLRHPYIKELILLQHADAISTRRVEKSLKTFYDEKMQSLDLTIKTPPFVSGDDLIKCGYKPGPKFKEMLNYIREGQDDGTFTTPGDAMQAVLMRFTLEGDPVYSNTLEVDEKEMQCLDC